MYGLKIVAVVAFIAVSVRGCEFSVQKWQKFLRECTSKHGSSEFRTVILSLIDGSEVPPTFVCDYKTDIVDHVLCMKDEFQECVPQEYKFLMELFPSKERLTEGFEFMCSHEDVFQKQCFDDDKLSFLKCYMGKMLQSSFSTTDLSAPHFKGVLCRGFRSKELCSRDYIGPCGKENIDVVIEALEKFFPMTSCPVPASQALANTVLGSVLIHGAPQASLKSEPRQYKPYTVIKN